MLKHTTVNILSFQKWWNKRPFPHFIYFHIISAPDWMLWLYRRLLINYSDWPNRENIIEGCYNSDKTQSDDASCKWQARRSDCIIQGITCLLVSYSSSFPLIFFSPYTPPVYLSLLLNLKNGSGTPCCFLLLIYLPHWKFQLFFRGSCFYFTQVGGFTKATTASLHFLCV